MIKLLAFSLALLFSSNVQAVETNKCFANNNELKNAVKEYIGDGRCDINLPRPCVPDPLNCVCDDVNQADYRGTLSTTISGKTCQAWDAQSPHEHDFTPADYPNKGLEGGHNYCRNPDDDDYSAWCFTTDPDEQFEYCNVPSCDLVTADECDIGKQYGWPINTWCVSDITSMWSMFKDASAFNQDLSSWDVSGVTNMGSMFRDASAFNGDLSSWNVASVTTMNAMFAFASAFNQDLSSWNVSGVTNMNSMFYDAAAFNGDLSSWNVSSVTNMWSMFYNAAAFNQDLSSWDVSSVTTMIWMFKDASAFNQDLSSWDLSSVTSMGSMFYNAAAFNQDLSSWDVSGVTDMDYMFKDASAFNQDLSSWNVSGVTNMNSMFYDAAAFNGDLSSWNVASVTTMNSMFYNAAAFNRDLCGWADTFNYATSGPIFAWSGCVFPYDPNLALGGPFCASNCLDATLRWKRGIGPLCPDKQN